jgi:hypothetical protein
MAADRLPDGPRGEETESIRADLALMGRIGQKVRAYAEETKIRAQRAIGSDELEVAEARIREGRCRVIIPHPTGTASAIPPDSVRAGFGSAPE